MDLVTGGAGFIGSHLVERLLGEGRRVRVLDDLSVGRKANLDFTIDNPNFEFIEGDVSDEEVANVAMDNVSRVFHLAARADIVPSIQNPDDYFRANVDGTYQILQAARKQEVGRFMYVASSSCYGIPDVYPTPEDTSFDAKYPYALTKCLGEQLVMHWGQVYQMPVLSVRFFNIYGPRARTSGTYGAVFGVFLAQLLKGKPLTLVGDGKQSRDFTFVGDAVDSLICAANSNLTGEIFNVGSGGHVSVNRIVELLQADEVVHIPKRPGEPDCTWADTSKIERMLNWKAKVPIEEGVRVLLENIEYWQDAPVWTEDKIANATSDWFKYLNDD